MKIRDLKTHLCCTILPPKMALLWGCIFPYLPITARNIRFPEKHEHVKRFVETDHFIPFDRIPMWYFWKDKTFFIELAYLFDIFEKLNTFNLSLQGCNVHILKKTEKISAFRKKLQLWKIKINEDYISNCFPLLHQFVTSNEINLSWNIKSVFVDHLSELIKKFEKYFEADND